MGFKVELKVSVPGSRFAKNFGFQLRCRECGTVLRELGNNAYTAERALIEIRRSGEKCPVCGASDWDKIRRIREESE